MAKLGMPATCGQHVSNMSVTLPNVTSFCPVPRQVNFGNRNFRHGPTKDRPCSRPAKCWLLCFSRHNILTMPLQPSASCCRSRSCRPWRTHCHICCCPHSCHQPTALAVGLATAIAAAMTLLLTRHRHCCCRCVANVLATTTLAVILTTAAKAVAAAAAISHCCYHVALAVVLVVTVAIVATSPLL